MLGIILHAHMQIPLLKSVLALNAYALIVFICHWLRRRMLTSFAKHIGVIDAASPWGVRNLQPSLRPSASSKGNVKGMSKYTK